MLSVGSRDPRGRARRAAGALLLGLAVAAAAGCADTSAGEDPAVGDVVVDPSDVAADESGGTEGRSTEGGSTEGGSTEGGSTEEAGPLLEEEGARAEGPAAGDGARVSVELAGLPVGGGEVLDADRTWCQVPFWRSVPEGVWLDIESARVRDQRGVLLGSGCAGSPPCVGVRISADALGGCAVAIRPVSPGVAFVEVQLNGTLSCPDRASCDAIGATDRSWTRITNPTEDVPSEEPSTPETTSPAGDGGSPDDQRSTPSDDGSSTSDDDLVTSGTG